jgi:hypothetical protein
MTVGFEYAYSLTDEVVEVKDFTADAAFAGSKGDVVILNGSGNVAASGNNPTTVLGVYEGGNFQGITQGGAYAATTVTNNSQSNKLAKVRIGGNAVYRVALKAAASAPVIGTAYGVTTGTAPTGAAAVLDTAQTTTGAIFKVVDYDATTKNCFVTITTRQIG